MAPAQFLRAARLNAVGRELRALNGAGSQISIGSFLAATTWCGRHQPNG
jgi:hypothetical protein